MAASYRSRHPWPRETVDVLAELRRRALPVCEIGAGNGRLTFGLADRVGRVDAVEPSQAMVDEALRTRVHPEVGWIVSTFEEAAIEGPYSLVVAAESIHWLDWSTAFGKIDSLLADDAHLALVGLHEFEPGAQVPGARPWLPDVMAAIVELSTNTDFEPYDLGGELRRRGLFDEVGRRRTPRRTVEETVDEVIQRLHSMNGLSPDRLGERTETFDRQVRLALEPHAPDGVIRTEVAAEIRWGRPLPAR